MIPSMYIGEQFMLERVRKRQGEAEHERMLAVLRKPYHGIVRYLFRFLKVF
jgi:hypothetical protein